MMVEVLHRLAMRSGSMMVGKRQGDNREGLLMVDLQQRHC